MHRIRKVRYLRTRYIRRKKRDARYVQEMEIGEAEVCRIAMEAACPLREDATTIETWIGAI